MRRVILESPYAGKQINHRCAEWERRRNILYARLAVRDALAKGDAPIASHLLYTQPRILNDQLESERQWGIEAGLMWGAVAEATVVYHDFGISKGMEYGIKIAEGAGRPVEMRLLPDADMHTVEWDDLNDGMW